MNTACRIIVVALLLCSGVARAQLGSADESEVLGALRHRVKLPATLPQPAPVNLPVLPISTPALPVAVPSLPVPLPLPVSLPLPLPLPLPGGSPAMETLRELLAIGTASGPLSPLVPSTACADPLACLPSNALEPVLAARCEFVGAPQVDLAFGSLPPGQDAHQWQRHSTVQVRCGPGVRYHFKLLQAGRVVSDGRLAADIHGKPASVQLESDGRSIDSAIHISDGQLRYHSVDAQLLDAQRQGRTPAISGPLVLGSDVQLVLEW